MAEFIDESGGLESTTIGIYRTAATVKGGRRFSFGALVVVGDRNGSVGLGYAKAPGVPAAIEKAQKYARKAMKRVELQEGTLPHSITGRYLASSVKLLPASAGTGVIAGGTVRAVLELAGVRDCLTKSVGSTNQKNLAKAVLEGLQGLRTKSKVAELRGVEIPTTTVEEKIEAGRRYAPAATAPAAARPNRAPKREGDQKRGGGRKGGGRGRRGRREDQPGGKAGPQASAPQATEPKGEAGTGS